MDSPYDILDATGPLAQAIDGYAVRTAQQEMAEAVYQALCDNETLIAEAGTGTGKTFAYLVPAIMSGRKVLISTGTKNLQDQLYHRDLPTVREALAMPVSVALLKGRGNYLCLHRLYSYRHEVRHAYPRHVTTVEKIANWAEQTHSGDLAEFSGLAESDPLWPRVTSTIDNCLGTDCEHFQDCFLTQARREAQAADIVVINHHLLLADMSLREEGFGELLPAADAYIIDEAHQLPDVASSFFGTALSSYQFIDLARDVRAEYRRDINESSQLMEMADELEKASRDARLVFGQRQQRLAWSQLNNRADVDAALNGLNHHLSTLSEALRPLSERSKGLENTYRRSLTLLQRLKLLSRHEEAEQIYWIDVHQRSFSLHMTPLKIDALFQQYQQSLAGAWVFTSATLAIENDLNYFAHQLGIEEAAMQQWHSPFDFQRQSLLYLPLKMPQPNQRDYIEVFVERAIEVIEASGGRAFVLFTSHRALNIAAGMLAERLDYPLFKQGDAPRDRLLQMFRDSGNAVLLGCQSFWEGVDVRGEALSCVIIDKLPFAAPDDPILQARLDLIKQQGGNPFMQVQLPQAVIALKQGVGRLLRDSSDTGVIMIGDPRLTGKPYGRRFIKSLPPMPITRVLADVEAFFDTTPAVLAEEGA